MVRRFATVILVILCFGLLLSAQAEDGSAVYPAIRKTYSTDGLAEPDQLAADYIDSILYGKGSSSRRSGAKGGTALSGTAGTMYSLLLDDITAIANGDRESTILVYEASEVYGKTAFSKEELGVDAIFDENGFTQKALEAIDRITDIDIDSVISPLLSNCPYELYWYDKKAGMGVDYPQISADSDNIYVKGNITVSLCVSADYSLNGDRYTVDTAYGANARAAAAKAGEIAAQYAGGSDESILRGYAAEICDLVNYNYAAAQGDTSYGSNPWQLVWVFDGDPDTSVVCEGYSKAFQYLCNLTSFSGGTRVIIVSGEMITESGSGDHMWNVVRLNGGSNYLADVTNVDKGSIGYPDQLFLAKSDSGDYTNGYTFVTDGGPVTYKYGKDTKKLYSEADLAIANVSDVTVYASEIRLSQTELQLQTGGSAQLAVTEILPEGAVCEISWTSSDSAVASVDGTGTVTALQAGNAVITAQTERGVTAECSVRVSGTSKLNTPIIVSRPDSVQIGAAFTIEATFDSHARYSTVFLYDPDGKYIGFSHNDGNQIVFSGWAEDCEPGMYQVRIISYGEGYANSDPAEFQIAVEEGERPAAPAITFSPNPPVAGKPFYFVFDQVYEMVNVDIYTANGSRYSGTDAKNKDRIEWGALGSGDWVAHASVCVNGVWSAVSETPFTVVSEGQLTLPDGLTRIEDEAFAGGSFRRVIVPDGCAYIGHRAFADCKNLTYVSCPAETVIEEDAFEGSGNAVIEKR